jgi:hypothetical protein
MSNELKSASEFEKVRDIALQRLGRNIFNFGLVEQWLKYLVTVSDVTTTGATFDSKTTKKTDKAQKMMLGQLVREILEKWHPDNLLPSHQIQDLFDVRTAHTFRIEMDFEGYEVVKKSLEEMVSDRNDLIHQFTKNYPLKTAENCLEAVLFLDEQREKHLSIMHNLQEIVKTHIELVEDIKKSFE